MASVTLNWSAVTQPGGVTIVTWNVYRGMVSGGPYSLIGSEPVGTTTYTDSTVVGGNTYYYVITSVDSGSVESAFSAEVSAHISNVGGQFIVLASDSLSNWGDSFAQRDITSAAGSGTITVVQPNGSALATVPPGEGIIFSDILYRYANLALPFSPNDPGLQFTFDNTLLLPTVTLFGRFFNLLNEVSEGITANVGLAQAGDCLDPRLFGGKGDGVSDDTQYVQEALDAARANVISGTGPTIVCIKSGVTFLVTPQGLDNQQRNFPPFNVHDTSSPLGLYCLLMDDGVTIRVDGTLLLGRSDAGDALIASNNITTGIAILMNKNAWVNGPWKLPSATTYASALSTYETGPRNSNITITGAGVIDCGASGSVGMNSFLDSLLDALNGTQKFNPTIEIATTWSDVFVTNTTNSNYIQAASDSELFGPGIATFSSPNVAGNVLIAVGRDDIAIPTISDSAGNSWTTFTSEAAGVIGNFIVAYCIAKPFAGNNTVRFDDGTASITHAESFVVETNFRTVPAIGVSGSGSSNNPSITLNGVTVTLTPHQAPVAYKMVLVGNVGFFLMVPGDNGNPLQSIIASAGPTMVVSPTKPKTATGAFRLIKSDNSIVGSGSERLTITNASFVGQWAFSVNPTLENIDANDLYYSPTFPFLYYLAILRGGGVSGNVVSDWEGAVSTSCTYGVFGWALNAGTSFTQNGINYGGWGSNTAMYSLMASDPLLMGWAFSDEFNFSLDHEQNQLINNRGKKWKSGHYYTLGEVAVPTAYGAGDPMLVVVGAGVSGDREPTWSALTVGGTLLDGFENFSPTVFNNPETAVAIPLQGFLGIGSAPLNAFSNPNFAFDNNLSTFAEGDSATNGFTSCTWYGWSNPPLATTSATLVMVTDAIITTSSGVPVDVYLLYSLDGGQTYKRVYTYQQTVTNGSRGITADSVSLPAGQDLTLIRVQMVGQAPNEIPHTNTTINTKAVARMYEAYVEVDSVSGVTWQSYGNLDNPYNSGVPGIPVALKLIGDSGRLPSAGVQILTDHITGNMAFPILFSGLDSAQIENNYISENLVSATAGQPIKVMMSCGMNIFGDGISENAKNLDSSQYALSNGTTIQGNFVEANGPLIVVDSTGSPRTNELLEIGPIQAGVYLSNPSLATSSLNIDNPQVDDSSITRGGVTTQPGNQISEVPGGFQNGVNKTFTLSFVPIQGTVTAYKNGLTLTPTVDYTTNSNLITYTVAPQPIPTNNLLITYQHQ